MWIEDIEGDLINLDKVCEISIVEKELRAYFSRWTDFAVLAIENNKNKLPPKAQLEHLKRILSR